MGSRGAARGGQTETVGFGDIAQGSTEEKKVPRLSLCVRTDLDHLCRHIAGDDGQALSLSRTHACVN